MRKVVFPGSFDPITKGHEDLVLRALNLFDEVVVAVGQHSTKKSMFPLDDRLAMIAQTFAQEPRVSVASYEGLTADFCLRVGAVAQLRGVRNAVDLSYEQTIAQMTRTMHPSLDTVVLLTAPAFSAIHSTVVRDVLDHGGDARSFVPECLSSRFAPGPSL
jgi:pantetheine-phosphate adenylyltransferase